MGSYFCGKNFKDLKLIYKKIYLILYRLTKPYPAIIFKGCKSNIVKQFLCDKIFVSGFQHKTKHFPKFETFSHGADDP
jgi:hypothetical protein